MVMATPFEHLFNPKRECLPNKGHREGGVGSIVSYYHEKQLSKKHEFDFDDIPEHLRPGY
jgi:hypothetical protein